MKTVSLSISPLHADVLATHLLIVLRQFITGKKEGDIPEEQMRLLAALDAAYEKLKALDDRQDDETPRKITLTISEAEAFIKAFTEPAFTGPAEKDDFYRNDSYAHYFAELYAGYLREVSEGYVEAMAA